MGALRILTSQMSMSPAGNRGSSQKVVEKEDVDSRAEAGDVSVITLLLLPSEKGQKMTRETV